MLSRQICTVVDLYLLARDQSPETYIFPNENVGCNPSLPPVYAGHMQVEEVPSRRLLYSKAM